MNNSNSSESPFVSQNEDDVLNLDLYPLRQTYQVEKFKLLCFCTCILIALVFIIIAASQRCIYNCHND